jgi:hypothetical protein
MKEIFYSVFLMFVLGTSVGTILIGIASCEQQQKQQTIEEPIGLRQKSDDRHKNVTEFTYGGCVYIRVGYGQSTWGSHKGNCTNPIHKYGR